jgi:hypothetical protein
MENVRANRILLKSAMVHGYVSTTVLRTCAYADPKQRFGEDGRHDPRRTKDVWDGFMSMVDNGKIEPVIYKEEYRGLEAVPKALGDAKDHKAWGRAIVRIDDNAEHELEQQRPKL